MITDLLNSVHEQNQPEQCTLVGFEPYKFTESGKPYTVVSATQAGRVAKFKVYQGSGQQLTSDRIGQELCFNLKSYQAQNGNIYISGFWNDRAAPQQAAQSPPQQPQTPPQGIKPATGEVRVAESKNVRAEALEKAVSLVVAGKHTTIELYGLADCIAGYIQTGQHPTGVAGANPPDRDFPNEPGSQR